jgi:hypothetical protein
MLAYCWLVEQPRGRCKVSTLHAQSGQMPANSIIYILKVRCKSARREVCGPAMLELDRVHSLIMCPLGFFCAAEPAVDSISVRIRRHFQRCHMQLLTRMIIQARWLDSGNLPVPVCRDLPAKINGAIEEVSGPEWLRPAATFKGNSQAMRGALHRQGVCSASMLLSKKLSVPTDGS